MYKILLHHLDYNKPRWKVAQQGKLVKVYTKMHLQNIQEILLKLRSFLICFKKYY